MKRRSLLNNKPATSIDDLFKEIRNLKRLLNLVKYHILYDKELFSEIKEAIGDEYTR